MFKVLIPRTISHTGTEYLKEKGCELLLSAPASLENPVWEQCHAILTGPSRKLRYDKNLLDRCENLKVISSFSAGVDYIDTAYAEKLGIQVTNSGDANSNAVAEQCPLFRKEQVHDSKKTAGYDEAICYFNQCLKRRTDPGR